MAEKVTVNVPHQHTKAEAIAKIEGGFHRVADQLGGKVSVEKQWAGDVMSFKAGAMGANVTGQLVAFDDHVTIEVELPWMLKALSGQVQEKLKSGTQLLLSKK